MDEYFKILTMEDFENYCRSRGIYVYFSETLSSKIKGLCFYGDGSYYVYLNPKHSNSQLKKTVIHELTHVLENHFEYPINEKEECEKRTHMILEELKNDIECNVFY